MTITKYKLRLSLSFLKSAMVAVKTSVPLTLILCLSGIVFLNSCIKDPTVPIITTAIGTDITVSSVATGGVITSDGGAEVTVRGVCWGTDHNPNITGPHTSDGKGIGGFASILTDLTSNTLYYLRAYATNIAGTAYGEEVTFTTIPIVFATLSTTPVTAVTATTAISGGNITSDGGGAITERGVCWNTNSEPTTSHFKTTNGPGTGSFASNLINLEPGKTYFIRSYAINNAGVAYGEQFSFKTKIADVEGNLYNSVTIGTQVWLKENLRTTKYNDNTSMPNVNDNTLWANLLTPGYCWYENNNTNKEIYGTLYNWYAVNTEKLCPAGWHVPTDTEFNTLEINLGMNPGVVDIWGWRGTDQGTQMKSTTGWDNAGNGTNASEFTGLPGGYRYGATGFFFLSGSITYWWSSTEHDADRAWYRRLDGTNSDVYKASTSKSGGKYVRCIKN